MQWIKRGRVYSPDGTLYWAKQYAFPPTPYPIRDGCIRLYLAFCDEQTVGRIGYVDVEADNPKNIIKVSEIPVLDIGQPGAFDENGVLPTCVIDVNGRLYMYYVGYQLGVGGKIRYYQFAGLATSDDGGESFIRAKRVPVIDRSDNELVNRTSVFVMQEEDRFRMWYVGGSQWTEVDGKALPVYNMRYLESKDGISWGPEGKVVIDFRDSDEHALGSPWVYKEDGIYKMFFSSRTRSRNYRLGYAESLDGYEWTRKDEEAGIDVSPNGWDSEMIAYASIVRHQEKTFMFYNGNNCGQTGFGYAELKR